MIKSTEIKLKALKIRKACAKKDEVEVEYYINDAASHGEFQIIIIKNNENDSLTLSAEFIQKLKDNGYKIDLKDNKNGWDNLHRYYKGAIKITWYK